MEDDICLKERYAIIFFLTKNGIDEEIISAIANGKHWNLGPPYNNGEFDEQAFYAMLDKLNIKGG